MGEAGLLEMTVAASKLTYNPRAKAKIQQHLKAALAQGWAAVHCSHTASHVATLSCCHPALALGLQVSLLAAQLTMCQPFVEPACTPRPNP